MEEIALDKIKEFEKDLLQEMEISHKDILAEIREKEDFTDAAQAKVLEVIKEIKKKYGSSGN